MSEKQSEAFDEWFKDAADGYEPPFNEEAWNKMEAKLDGQTKRRRRPLAWWWWLTDALVVGVVLYMAFGPNVRIKKENGTDEQVANMLPQTTKPETNKDGIYNKEITAPVNETEQETVALAPVPDEKQEPGAGGASVNKNAPNAADKASAATDTEKSGKDNLGNAGNTKSKSNSTVAAVSPSFSNKKTTAKTNRKNTKNGAGSLPLSGQGENVVKGRLKPKRTAKLTDADNGIAQNPTATPDEKLLQSGGKQDVVAISTIADSTGLAQKATVSPITKNDSAAIVSTIKKKDPLDTAALKNEAKKKSSDRPVSNKGKFFIYGAASPEWSFIFGNKTGKATMAYGAGMGYNFGKRWAVMAGFNITKKLYTAGEGDYKIIKGSYWDNPAITINKVEADCNVYEIPVAVKYFIQQRQRYSLYATLGVSTAIMKKEYYDYDFTRNGWPNSYKNTYKTGKSQFLSGAIISVGYARRLNKSFSVMAEPYFKMPLQGVGMGEVKIGSVGVSVGVQYTLPGFKK
jgi:hypothetical protein